MARAAMMTFAAAAAPTRLPATPGTTSSTATAATTRSRAGRGTTCLTGAAESITAGAALTPTTSRAARQEDHRRRLGQPVVHRRRQHPARPRQPARRRYQRTYAEVDRQVVPRQGPPDGQEF